MGCGTGQFGYGSGYGEAGAGATAWVVHGVTIYHQVQIMLLVIIGWDAPPLSSSHHQDYPIFRRSRTRPSLGTVASQVICRKMVLLFVKLVFVEI